MMTKETQTLDYVKLVQDALARTEIAGNVRDYPTHVVVKLAMGREFVVSHDFIQLAGKRNLDYVVRYKAGAEQ